MTPVTRTCSGTCVALPVAPRPTDTAAVVYRSDDRVRATWRPHADTTRPFDAGPQCVLRDARVVDRDGAVGVRFTVENVGARDGGFRALVTPASVSDTSTPVGFAVPQGGAVTGTVVPPVLGGLPSDGSAFTHAVDGDTRRFEVGRE